ncbi:hypothetical protein GGTG_03041 [Gaeumannomyces tritici R3-111a-1]|uniref:Uncharacterized protein n=1 Tax=Gaeumannomyces tritici (strain R3-111a-1) TaxID=644352 RepID=J3NP35_GAET3|nr:hypothetical protein GGTG_03041 [Gaeumannomyces tritici R3-111a-1]EJT77938.1 hypothetical protein GGTG_03041 [Gaeumannomyces tritici R3-111a-1]
MASMRPVIEGRWICCYDVTTVSNFCAGTVLQDVDSQSRPVATGQPHSGVLRRRAKEQRGRGTKRNAQPREGAWKQSRGRGTQPTRKVRAGQSVDVAGSGVPIRACQRCRAWRPRRRQESQNENGGRPMREIKPRSGPGERVKRGERAREELERSQRGAREEAGEEPA